MRIADIMCDQQSPQQPLYEGFTKEQLICRLVGHRPCRNAVDAFFVCQFCYDSSYGGGYICTVCSVCQIEVDEDSVPALSEFSLKVHENDHIHYIRSVCQYCDSNGSIEEEFEDDD